MTSPTDFFTAHFGDSVEPPDSRWMTMHDLLADNGLAILSEHDRLTRSGEPPAAAAKYLVEWFGGALSAAVGLTYALTGAGLIADASVRWLVNPGGWPDWVDPSGCQVAVPPDHVWADLAGSYVLADATSVRGAAVDALTAHLSPYIEIAHGLARVGRTSLWSEVADGLGLILNGRPNEAGTATQLAALRSLLNEPGAPWRRQPRSWVSSQPNAFVVGQKGGCCLAYTGQAPTGIDDASSIQLEDSAVDVEYQKRFPIRPGEYDYCLTCCLRDVDDAEARQVFWATMNAEEAAARSVL